MNGQIPLPNAPDIAVKMEEQMDEGQLDRLATGVTVDTAIASSSSSVRLSLSRESLNHFCLTCRL
jgi:histone acetyltransferase